MRLAEAELFIEATPARVFELFSTADGLCSWMAAEATVDLRPGGSWRWVHENGHTCSGAYLVIDAPRLLSFTYGWESGPFAHVAPGSTEVTVTFEATDDGTHVRVHHSGLAPTDADRHTGGWTYFLDVLARTAGRHESTEDTDPERKFPHDSTR